MKRAVAFSLVFALLLAGGAAFAKKNRGDGGRFLIRAPHPMAKIANDHPSYVGARRALWNCWLEKRPCAVTLLFVYGDNEERRHDALVEVGSDGARSVILREERWSRAFSGLDSQITPSATGERPPRRFLRLERIPIHGALDAAALAESDTTGPEQWRLRFSDEKAMAGSTLHGEIRVIGDQGTAVW